ncbi:hypothetical protein [Rhizobium leguminosarum]|uniref:hypothetical protein n=1 Tax=Rhizobium leguminosarum TaxID=384 RepID=UPI001FEE56B4|nr:hypothetical protein [Rhizobium leguminosarum]
MISINAPEPSRPSLVESPSFEALVIPRKLSRSHDRTFLTQPANLAFPRHAKAQTVGITYDAIDEDGPDPASEAGKTFPHDPMGTVTAFYSALAAADGETASALVVPEKRGQGPFNEASIHAYFGAMSQPLELTGTALRGNDDVRVSYEYVTNDSRRCRGRADVQTTYVWQDLGLKDQGGTAANASARNRNRFSESRTCRFKVLERRRFTTVTAMTASPKQLPHLVCGLAILTSNTYGSWHRICAIAYPFRLRPHDHNTSRRDRAADRSDRARSVSMP